MDWIPSGLGLGRMKGFCEKGNETSVYRQRGDFSRKESLLLKKKPCASLIDN